MGPRALHKNPLRSLGFHEHMVDIFVEEGESDELQQLEDFQLDNMDADVEEEAREHPQESLIYVEHTGSQTDSVIVNMSQISWSIRLLSKVSPRPSRTLCGCGRGSS